MAGNLTERRKKVLRQAEEARKNDKIYPLEIYQATAEKGYDERGPFAGHTQNIQPKNMGIRQARQYWLQHDLEAGKNSELYRENRVQKYADQQRLQEEKKKKDQARRKKKQYEIADRLLRK